VGAVMFAATQTKLTHQLRNYTHMIHLYNILRNKISYRFDEKKINHFLAQEDRFAAKLNGQYKSSKLARLVKIIEKQVITNRDKLWIENNTGIRDNKVGGYSLLFSQVPLNEIGRVNKYFSEYNGILENGGIFVCWFETSCVCKMKLYARYPVYIANIIYLVIFLWHRMFPKLPLFNKIYWTVTKGRKRIFPRSEILGRLYYCGFKVIAEKSISGKQYIIAQKVQSPLNDAHPSYGPIVRLRRVGKDGKLVNIYKFRTMHAYSEYLQPYIYENNRLEKGGKFKEDYRISAWGRFMRKFWLDEVPMVINLIKGDIKFVGIRPLSRQYFDLYSPDMKEFRTRIKPGLLPPYYADMPNTLDEIQESEKKYIAQYLKSPFRTDCKYLYKILYNIVIKRERSK